MDSEIVCPFCGHRCPLAGDPVHPSAFERHGRFDLYRCPCGAVGSPSGDIWVAGWPMDDVVQVLCHGILEVERGACDLNLNYVTHTDPPMLMLWAKRRPGPGGRSGRDEGGRSCRSTSEETASGSSTSTRGRGTARTPGAPTAWPNRP